MSLRNRIIVQLWAEANQETKQEDIDELLENMTVARLLEMLEYMQEEVGL